MAFTLLQTQIEYSSEPPAHVAVPLLSTCAVTHSAPCLGGGLAECEGDGDGLADFDGEGEGDGLFDGLFDGLGLVVGVIVDVGLVVWVLVDGLGLPDGLLLVDELGLGEADEDGLPEGFTLDGLM